MDQEIFTYYTLVGASTETYKIAFKDIHYILILCVIHLIYYIPFLNSFSRFPLSLDLFASNSKENK